MNVATTASRRGTDIFAYLLSPKCENSESRSLFDDLCAESTSELGEGSVFPMLLSDDRVSMLYAVFTTPRSVSQSQYNYTI